MKKTLLTVSLFFSFVFLQVKGYSQNGLKKGEVVQNLAIKKTLNSSTSQGALKGLQKKLTILDFFATWCVPCVKALPNLYAIQKKFSESLGIVLISTEDEQRLSKFIAARPGFSFPLIVDADQSISKIFQPPSFPYTVVLNEKNEIIAVTDAGSITEASITEWLSGKIQNAVVNTVVEKSKPLSVIMDSKKRSDNKMIALSQDFMYAAKTGDATDEFINKLKSLSYDELKNGLTNDDEKKAFWINAYNGYTQALLQKNPEAYKNRGQFFKSEQIELAGKKFSLDDIEHGILRRSKIKWSLGYLSKWFPGKTEKQLRVDKLDYRLHFALNCGAKSCPPVAFYDAANINTQLDVATTAYLTGEAEYDPEKNTLGLPAIMSWFRKDFGGRKKMLQLVKQKGIVPETADPKIYFNKYNWELHLNNFQN